MEVSYHIYRHTNPLQQVIVIKENLILLIKMKVKNMS